MGGIVVKGYCYYNPQRQKKEQDRFYRRLYRIKEVLEEMDLSSRRKLGIKELVEGIAGQYSKYLEVDIQKDGAKVRFRTKAIS